MLVLSKKKKNIIVPKDLEKRRRSKWYVKSFYWFRSDKGGNTLDLIQILFLLRFHCSPDRWLKRWRTQNVLIKFGINTPRNDWIQLASWMVYFPWINCAVMVLKTLKSKWFFTSECSSTNFPWINSVIMILKTFKAKGIFTPEYSIRWKRKTSVRSRSTRFKSYESNRPRVVRNTRDGSSRLLRFCSMSRK